MARLLRTTLGLLLVVLVGFAGTIQASLTFDSGADSPADNPSENSDDDQTDGTPAVDIFYAEKQLEISARLTEMDKTSSAPLPRDPENSPAQFLARPVPFLLPVSALLSRSGLLPRAPSLA